jgi:hypothetical protein
VQNRARQNLAFSRLKRDERAQQLAFRADDAKFLDVHLHALDQGAKVVATRAVVIGPQPPRHAGLDIVGDDLPVAGRAVALRLDALVGDGEVAWDTVKRMTVLPAALRRDLKIATEATRFL